MNIKDPFSYSARWDSVGLDCSNCIHFKAPETWPDIRQESKCILNQISLKIELGKDNYKNGEWFCLQFKNNGSAFPKAVEELNTVLKQLEAKVLYGTYGNGFLLEYRFEELP